MSSRKFKFVSPGIFLSEIDNSALQSQGVGTPIGPVVVGRTLRGPALRPVTVNSFSEFVTIFGEPQPGGNGQDIWREGTDRLGPTYAAYAAQAWLRHNSPLTVIRLLGDQGPNATSEGYAGWGGTNKTAPVNFGSVGGGTDPGYAGYGGAYGIFTMNSGTVGINANNGPNHGAVLSAIIYTNNTVTPALYGSPLSGNFGSFTTNATASQAVVMPTNSAGNFVVAIGTIGQHGAGTADRFEFNFNRNSDKYIRKVLSTNPTLLNGEITSTAASQTYFLGETFDAMLRTGSIGDYNLGAGNVNSLNTNMASYSDMNNAFIIGLATQADLNWNDKAFEKKEPQTTWIIGQDLGDATGFSYDSAQKLFRLHSMDHGEWVQSNLKVSIEDIRPPSNDSDTYGTFTVALRSIGDSDKNPMYVERFSGCDLNPNSPNYIARKIGDKYVAWDYTDERLLEYGSYPNASKFVRVEVNADLDDGALDSRYLPFGFFGTPRWNLLTAVSNSLGTAVTDIGSNGRLESTAMIAANNDIAMYDANFLSVSSSAFVVANVGGNQGSAGFDAGTPNISYLTASYFMPTVPLRVSSSAGQLADPTNAYWGASVGRAASYNTYDESIVDFLRVPGADLDPESNIYQEHPYVFTLDDLSGSGPTLKNHCQYVSGSRVHSTTNQKSLTAVYGWEAVLTGSTLDDAEGHIGGWDRFTTLFHGGFNGLDITEKDPFRNNAFVSSPTQANDYRYQTIKRAIDTLRDPEFVEFNLATIPALTQQDLTDHLIETCEERADALAVIDLEGDYVPRTENTATAAARRPNVGETVRNLKLRNINSSYGAAYFPWVQIRDTNNSQVVDVPPSVVALGTISNSERQSSLWFAPAGFTRGGLSDGAAGIPVVGIKAQLTSKDRDNLYEANINPIASFPAEGIVVFGQKTLQVTPSALDRVNVRRLLIYIKKQVSRIAATTLFEQNVQATWDRFSNRVETLLSGIKAAQGLTDYRVVLDKSTTTPELIDRNIMYAKVFLKPARAIEFVALDFTVTDSGASFDD